MKFLERCPLPPFYTFTVTRKLFRCGTNVPQSPSVRHREPCYFCLQTSSRACNLTCLTGLLQRETQFIRPSPTCGSASRMRSSKVIFLVTTFTWLHLVAAEPAPDSPETNEADHSHSAGCDCMEYWTCVMSGGSPYSYCGLSESNVCCFVPQGAKPVGLFPSNIGRPNKGRCGKKGNGSGKDGIAEPSEWPWHAAVLEKPDDLYVCGASLLDESWVLTAAHCVDDYVSTRGEALKVRLGEHDVTSTQELLRHEEYDVASVVLYPGFDNATLAHDIALIHLRHPAKQRPNIDVVCLPKQGSNFPDTTAEIQAHTSCVITGWGRRSETSEHSVILKEVKVPLWQNSACERALRQQFGSSYSLPNTSICAGAKDRDACDGDGGGPLVCEQSGQWYQVGIVSFGIGCGRRNTPGVYTRVSMYEQWIKDIILRHKNRQ
ncbi:Serine proteinase stubble [Zootermopsis nevadensis]|uniref:Phenoloxidase-activating factor 2 n=3 Tax=Zootermopsis nevadensis TaxID=136037 RepID=A0A067QSK2_ZOONE|nr:Serine proteinase stubble [Zootermopsis nevadensis]